MHPANVRQRTARWQSWHLHLRSSARSVHDRVITDVVGAAVATRSAQPWFFIRYWQGGPHIRFRIRDLAEADLPALADELRGRLATAGRLTAGEEPLDPDTYRGAAGQLAASGELDGPLDVADLLDPGVHPATYEPELDRYGGPSLMPATEAAFGVSSELALRFLRAAPATRTRAGLALQATRCAAQALGSPTEQATYFHNGLQIWRTWAAGFGYSPTQLDQLTAVAAVPQNGGVPPVLAGWTAAMADLAGTVAQLSTVHPAQVLFSHVHMLHNRIGLSLVEELQTYARLVRAFGHRANEPIEERQ